MSYTDLTFHGETDRTMATAAVDRAFQVSTTGCDYRSQLFLWYAFDAPTQIVLRVQAWAQDPNFVRLDIEVADDTTSRADLVDDAPRRSPSQRPAEEPAQ